MPLLSSQERSLATAISALAYCNPFVPERIAYEREALGEDFTERDPVWSLRTDPYQQHPNIAKLLSRAESLANRLRDRLAQGADASGQDLALYEDLVIYLLFYHTEPKFGDVILGAPELSPDTFGFYGELRDEVERFLKIPQVKLPSSYEAPHLFACFFQVRRAFHHIFRYIIGTSMAAARLRATVWESIFTHDIRRYRRMLYERMGDITTLVTGPSGTGKELAARAIAFSRYVPFDEKARRFTERPRSAFLPLNLSALSPTLIESELFGHRRGAFTGALEDRVGWLEVCSPSGTVFLDEIGDTDVAIQAKLLRVIQTRAFQRLGETDTRHFRGKLIAATNRNLGREMRAGRFREDLYYRLCSDIVTTPSLHEQLRESPGELRNLIVFIARQEAGEVAEELAEEVTTWIGQNLGAEYPWPGNFRELEQCVRNVLIRKEYVPPRPAERNTREGLANDFCDGTVTADEVLRRYCTIVYAQTGNYVETARRLAVDRRTVKSKIDPQLLGKLRREPL